MSTPRWPDALRAPETAHVAALLEGYWLALAQLPDLLLREELILAEALTARLRGIVIELMLAMNGIAFPADTAHLNGYLGASQRVALERTLIAPNNGVAPVAGRAPWLARAVALTVIYRWYAPQCVARFAVAYPQAAEARAWAALRAALPEWPAHITTDLGE